MKLHVARLAALLLPLTTAFAQDGVFKLPVTKHSNIENFLARRSETVSVTLENQLVAYMVNVSVGTPPQVVQVILDTGSSDLWFPASSACQSSSECPYGSFDPNSSSTYEEITGETFSIQYADSSGASGDYFTDTIEVAAAKLQNFTMALGSDLTNQAQGQASGVFGIAYVADESNVNFHYPNFPQALVNQDLIKSPAYSLYLDDQDSNVGTILFGGIDTAKFSGDLHVLDVEPTKGVYAVFTVPLTSVTYKDSSSTTTVSQGSSTAILDSGTSFTIVPRSVFTAILQAFGDIDITQSSGNYYLPCSAGKSSSRYFTFQFGNGSAALSLQVDLSEFLIQASQSMCVLGFDLTSDDTYTLGDTFLRSVYAVYDLANNQVGLAKANFDPSASNVVPFPSKGSKITDLHATSSNATGTSTSSSSGSTASATGGSSNAAVRLVGRSSLASLAIVAAVMFVSVF